MRWILVFLSFFGLAFACSKSDKKTVTNDPVNDSGPRNRLADESVLANATLLFDTVKDVDVPGLDLKLTRIRAFQSVEPSLGASLETETFYIEIWFKIGNDKENRRWLSPSLKSAADGTLYPWYLPPGSTAFYQEDVSGTQVPVKVDLENTFLLKLPSLVSVAQYSGNPNSVPTPNGSSITKRIETTDQTTLGSSGFEKVINYRLDAQMVLGRGIRSVEVAATPKTGTLSCLVRKRLGGEDIGNSFLSEAVELGFYIDKLGNNATNEAQRSDDYFVIPWSTSLGITGINVKQKSVSLLRQRAAPFYTYRTLAANYNETTPKVTGFERLLRRCNAETNEANAAPLDKGTFSILKVTATEAYPFGLSVVPTAAISHCSGYNLATDANKFKSLSANSCAAVWLSTLGDGLATGANPPPNVWDGTKYVHDAGGEEKNITFATEHIEQSSVVKVNF